MVSAIQIHGGEEAFIDDEDYDRVSLFKWYMRHGYACTAYHKGGYSRTDKDRTHNMSMHRYLMGFPDGVVDHINRDRLDNRKSNLRVVTYAQNALNADRPAGVTGYLGVKKEKGANVYCARVGDHTVGYYRTALKAAQARDIECLKRRGEFAILNFDPSELPAKVVPLMPRNVGERTSSVTGVSYAATQRRKNKWRVVVSKVHLGWFATEEEAIQAKEQYASQIS